MKMSKAFIVKFAIYSVVLGYVLLDFFVIGGPLKKAADRKAGKEREEQVQDMESRKIAAFVYRYPLYLSQLDYYAKLRLSHVGIDISELSSNQLFHVRTRFMDEMIAGIIFRVKTDANANLYTVDESEVKAAAERFMSRFKSENELAQRMGQLSVEGEKEIALRLEAVLQQELYLKDLLEKSVVVNEADWKQFYEAKRDELSQPERVRARHIYLSHLDNMDDGEKKIREVFAKLEQGEDFAALVEQYSEDLNSKKRGGDLGWMSKQRAPVEFATWLFPETAEDRLVEPRVIESKLGWHIIQMTDHKPAELVSFDDVKDELVEAARIRAVEGALKKLKQRMVLEAGIMRRHKDKKKDSVTLKSRKCRIEIFQDIFSFPLSDV